MTHLKWNALSMGLENKSKFNVIVICFFLFTTMSSCNGQTKKTEQLLAQSNNKKTELRDTINRPKINVKVNKQYDRNGNIIKYDSTYSYAYSSHGGQSAPMNNDSIFNQFKTYFNMHSSSFMNKQNNNVFLTDSLFKYDFFNEDYFQKRFELNQKLFNDFYRQMDSLKGNYLQKKYPNKNHKNKTY
jgi:hypothetical protein